MSDSIYELSGVVRRYGEREALRIEHLAIRRGAIVSVTGHNGSGKSTLLRLLAFLDAPSEGRILFDGRETAGGGTALRREATLLLQEPYLLKRSVFENVAYGLRVRGERAGLKDRVEDALLGVGLDPRAFSKRGWHELSGGEAQRTALASRLALAPRVLLLDEPTASCDARSATLIQEAALDARERLGTTIVVVSHDLAWLREVADETLRLEDGRLRNA